MALVFHRGAGPFRRRAAPLLSGGEAENPLLFGILHAVRPGDGTHLCTVQHQGRTLAAAVQSPLRPLVLARAAVAPLRELARGWHERDLPLSAVVGPVRAASTFAAAWPGAPLALGLSMRSYSLTRVSPPRGVPGGLRHASRDDVPLLTGWAAAFVAESGSSAGDPEQIVQSGVRERRLFVWRTVDADPPVTMAAWSARTPTSARVNLVYTPPALRGRGYASACVAAVSQRLLDEGLERCFLFADIANPTSNAIYQRLGYRPLADFAEYRSPHPSR